MKEVVIVSACRTPVGRYMGALKNVEAYDLAASILNDVISRINLDPEIVDEVIMGQSYQNGEYVNIARMGLLQAGWPDTIPGMTIDRRCCTGLKEFLDSDSGHKIAEFRCSYRIFSCCQGCRNAREHTVTCSDSIRLG